jgi:hypothetical protein
MKNLFFLMLILVTVAFSVVYRPSETPSKVIDRNQPMEATLPDRVRVPKNL